jgi:hypothetical protein
LPIEIIRAIAVQCNVPALPGFGRSPTETLAKCRTLCRATSEAGKAALLQAARRRRYGPQRLRIPNCDRSPEQALALFRNTGLGLLVKTIHIDVMPILSHPKQKDLVMEYFNDKGLPGRTAEQRATAVLEELEVATKQQEDFFDTLKTRVGFKKLTDVLDCMPNLEELETQMLNFWFFTVDNVMFEYLTNHYCDTSPSKIVHWRLMPQVFDLIERYGLKKLRLETDSSLLGEVLASRLNGASRTNSRRLTTISANTLSQSCRTLTHIALSMSFMDFACFGRYRESEYIGFQNAPGFRTLLSSAVNLVTLDLSFSIDHGGLSDRRRIDHHWLHEVLRDQFWPKLKHFHLLCAGVDLRILTTFLRSHKQSLTAVVL